MTDDAANIWKRLDNHGQQIADINQRFAVVDSRVSAIESRFDTMMQMQAEGRAEVRQMLKELHAELGSLRSEYLRAEGMRAGMEAARKESASWRERILSNLPSIVMMLLALGWINGVITKG